MDVWLVVGVVAIGLVHGVLPDHGWPIAAAYALGRRRKFLYGTAAGLILGVGHLVSSVALVLAYFWVSEFAAFADSPWMRYVAGGLLVLLGVREYRHGGHGGHAHDDPLGDGDHSHGNGHSHGDDHTHGDHSHSDGDGHVHAHDGDDHAHDGDDHAHDGDDHAHDGDDHAHDDDGIVDRIRGRLPGGDGHRHLTNAHAEQGLAALGMTALLLGFAHEEPIQILAICAGTAFCLELMLVYSLAVIVAILVPTLLLIVGYERHRETVERYTPYLPAITATVLIGMGLAFIFGVV